MPFSFVSNDIPRILPELMLMLLALLVLGSDILERWGTDPEAQIERSKASGQLAAIGLGLVFLAALIQSKFLFTIPEPTPPSDILNSVANLFIGFGHNLQQSGPGGDPILGAFATDHLTMIARLIFIGAAFLTTLLALDYRPSGNPGEFYALILFSTAGMNIMAAATELMTAYVALELSSISLYILAGYFRNERKSAEAGLKYFLFGAISSGILLYGMSLAYGFTASVHRATGGEPVIGTWFSEIARAAQSGQGDTSLLTLAMVFIIAGIGYKVAVVPFHSWSPDVYQGAPTPITAFISTASKTAGFILLFRVLAMAFPTIVGQPGGGFVGLNNLASLVGLTSFTGWTSLLALIALVTVVVGNLSALPQTNAKRLLAYSSIGHAGFLLLALLLWSSTSPSDRTFGTSSLIYYLIVYTFTNLGAFGALAVISEAVGGDEMSDLNGLWRRNIGLSLILTVLVLSLAGVPPLSGFWAKFFVFMTGYKAGAIWLVAIAVAMTIVSLYYYLRFLKAMWMNEPTSTERVAVPRSMNATLIISTVLVVLLGLFPGVIWNILGQATLIAGQ